eukprot:5116528-Pyramimonas_sp.AAC.1
MCIRDSAAPPARQSALARTGAPPSCSAESPTTRPGGTGTARQRVGVGRDAPPPFSLSTFSSSSSSSSSSA